MEKSALPPSSSKTATAFGRLKAALLALPDTDENGFEGLIAALLGSITKVSFRLAASGTQGGQDGRGDGPMGAVSFEAKLYTSKLSKSVVNNKATEIIASASPPDVWALAATVGLTTQIESTLRAAFARTETSLLVLDWPSNSNLPPLALLCAMAPQVLLDFLIRHWPDAVAIKEVAADLTELAALPDFDNRSSALRNELLAPTLGAPIALSANRANFSKLFATRDKAMHRFGQPLAPKATFPLPAVDRSDRASLDAIFVEPPSTELIAVIGDQGCGKSWAVAQSWLAQDEPPFLVYLTSSEALAAQGQIMSQLVTEKLIEQAGGIVTEEALRRWLRRLDRWAIVPAATPRLVVVVDGLNERARTDWSPWLSTLTAYVGSIGGRVVTTSRARYFKRIENRLTIPCRLISVGEFTDDELDMALASHGVSPNQIAPRVRPSLRNPRILGIALELLGDAEIRTAEELSIERLLFEHVRRHQSEPVRVETPYQFSRLLSEHANEVRNRIISNVGEDRFVFDSYDSKGAPQYDLPRDLLPVVQEHFFEALDDDPSLYRLTENGLVFGLALATIRELQAAERNNCSVSERLADIIEPVAALDMAAEVLFAAALLTSVDGQMTQRIGAALLERYVVQQNIDDDCYPAFCGIVRNMPAAALDTLFALDTTERQAQHKDWIVAALRNAREDANAWDVIKVRLDEWLRLYSLDPAHGVIPHDDDEKRAQALDEARIKIDGKLEALTVCERQILDEKLNRNDGINSLTLNEDVFLLLAGMPLESFAEALTCWAFARSLNGGYRVPWRDYNFVVQHNNRDWFETRTTMINVGRCFANDDASKAARWALVYILRATGDAEDGDRAEAIADTLVEDWQRFEGWRQVESYCPTDPCDPDSEYPDEIAATAERYQAMIPSKLMVNRWLGQNEHFLRDAGPGIARFEPKIGAKLNRAVLEDIIDRPSAIAVSTISWLCSAAALMEHDIVDRALNRAAALSHPEKPEGGSGDNDWVVSQYLLVIAFQHLDGDAQVDALRKLTEHGPPLLLLDEVFQPAKLENVDGLLDQAIQSSEEHRLLMALAFVRSSKSSLSDSAIYRIRQLITHPKPSVRGLAMQISAEYPDETQLASFAQSGWSANNLNEREEFYERWHGSSLILAAAEHGFISSADAVARIIPERHADAVGVLGHVAVGKPLANLLAEAFTRVLDVTIPFPPPRIMQSDSLDADAVARFSIDCNDDDLTIDQAFKRMNDSDEEFSTRQKAGWERFEAFNQELTKSGAELILQNVGFEAFNAISMSHQETLIAMAKQIFELPRARLPRIANLASRVARALSSTDAAIAIKLFRACESREGYVRISCTQAGIPLMTWDAWHSLRSEAMEAYWRERLERAPNDYILSIEVLASCIAGHQDFLETYAESAIATGHPVSTARALMILGYCDEGNFVQSTIQRFRNRNGLVGQAANAAYYAYERNIWSKFWFSQIAITVEPIDFWRYAILLGKIADGRILLRNSEPNHGFLLNRFGWSLEKSLSDRFEAWKKKRSKKLFGGERPREIYLPMRPQLGFEGFE